MRPTNDPRDPRQRGRIELFACRRGLSLRYRKSAAIAAQAATPARAASTQDGEDLVGISPVLLVLAAAAAIGVIVLVTDDENEPASP